MPATRRPFVRLASSLGVSVFLLAGCAAQGQPSQPVGPIDETSAPAVAEYCRDVADGAVLQASRDASAWTDEDIVNDAIELCADQPDLAWTDALVHAASQPEPALSSLKQVFPITDDQGYTFDLAVDFRLIDITADPSTEPPGVTAATRTMGMSISLTNTTPQRDITFKAVSGIISPLDLSTFIFSAVYNEGSPVCSVIQPWDGRCRWVMGYGRMENGQTVSAGATYPLKVWGGTPNGGDISTLLRGIPEASWAEVSESLSKPDGYRITYAAGDGSRFATICASEAMVPVLVSTAPCEAP
ncbi:hypothetical protein [Microbacterium sp. Leaf179]|uniref:hypothetical protein n=1 Tax=Microbacterium sp. Leaf179 TaxID=1736288 RepID=UPI000A452635|nr:hypothetical protein [Microbacterium sp. Leaf179]